jgi:hypothetical protein
MGRRRRGVSEAKDTYSNTDQRHALILEAFGIAMVGLLCFYIHFVI